MSRATLPIHDVTTRFVKGTCTHNCPDTCATVTEVRGGRAVGFKGGIPDSPAEQSAAMEAPGHRRHVENGEVPERSVRR